jgi:hypothetical protein
MPRTGQESRSETQRSEGQVDLGMILRGLEVQAGHESGLFVYNSGKVFLWDFPGGDNLQGIGDEQFNVIHDFSPVENFESPHCSHSDESQYQQRLQLHHQCREGD